MRRVVLLLGLGVALGFLVLVSLRGGEPASSVDAVLLAPEGSAYRQELDDLAEGAGSTMGAREGALSSEGEASAPARPASSSQPSSWRSRSSVPYAPGPGCLLTGRLLDASGQPVSSVSLESVDEILGSPQRLPTNGTGRFRLWVPAVGEATVVFSKVNVGRSEPLTIVTDATPELDVGTVWLLEEGTIEGVVQLADGSPVPDVLVVASAQKRSSLGGLGVSQAATGKDGTFSLRGLAEGQFSLTVAGKDPYPLTTDVTAATHDRGVILEVEALLLVVRCVAESGRLVPFQMISKTALPGSSAEAASPMESFRKTPAVESMVVHAAVGAEHRLQAKAEDGRVYTASVDSTLVAGQHDVQLRSEAEEFASVVLRVPKRGGFGEDRLQVVSLKVDGKRMEVLERESAFHPTCLNVVLDGLPKGDYELECELGGAGFEVLASPVRRFRLAPPEDQLLEFTRILGGRVGLNLTLTDDRQGWMTCSIHIKGEKEPDSSYTTFAFASYPPRDFGQATVFPGRVIQSRAFTPGRYKVRLSSDGYRPVITVAEIKAGEVASIQMALEVDPAAPAREAAKK